MIEISVIIPSFNAGIFTVKTIHSILKQTIIEKIEIIVVDDGSDSSTISLLESIPPHENLKIIYQKNQGACRARNYGATFARGKYIAFVDCDDICLPMKFEKQMNYLKKHEDVLMVYTPEYLIDAEDNVLDLWGYAKNLEPNFDNMILGNIIGSSTPLIKLEAFNLIGMWDENIFTTADWDLWLRLSLVGRIGYFYEPLSLSRQVSKYNANNLEKFYYEGIYTINKYKNNITSSIYRKAIIDLKMRVFKLAIKSGNYSELFILLSK